MPSKVATEIMEQVTELRDIVIEVKTDMTWLKKLVYLATGVSMTACAGIFVQIFMATVK